MAGIAAHFTITVTAKPTAAAKTMNQLKSAMDTMAKTATNASLGIQAAVQSLQAHINQVTGNDARYPTSTTASEPDSTSS